MSVVGIVPAKGTSERVKDKNLQLLGGKYLVEIAVDRLFRSCVDRVVLDTDDARIRDACFEYPVDQLFRPDHLTSNKMNFNNLIQWEIDTLELSPSDLIVHTFSTAPFLKAETIDIIVKTLEANRQLDSATTVTSVKKPFWYESNPSYDVKVLESTADMSPLVIETGGLYVFYVDTFLQQGRRLGQSPLFYDVGMIEGLDIDEPKDLELARRLHGQV